MKLPPPFDKPLPFWRLAIITFFALSALGAHAASFDELLDNLNTEIARSVELKPDGKKNDSRDVAHAAQLQRDLAHGDYENVRSILAQLAESSLTPVAKQIISELQRQLPDYVEGKKKEFAAQISGAIERAGTACLAAKKESELDVIFVELNSLRQRHSVFTADNRAINKLDSAVQFVTRWQEYLAQLAGGYDDAARNILRQLADSPTGYPILPRAKILDRLGVNKTTGEAATGADEILHAVKSLDDLPKAMAELSSRAVNDSRLGESALTSRNAVMQLVRGYAALKAGDYATAMASANGNFSPGVNRFGYGEAFPSADITRIRMMLFAAVLPHYFALPENPQPKADENPSNFLERLISEAAGRKDWDAVARILEAYKLCAFNSNPPMWLTGDLASCIAFLNGQKLEQADSRTAAIVAYYKVLQQPPGRFNPAPQAAERLGILLKGHPEELQEAVRDFLRTP